MKLISTVRPRWPATLLGTGARCDLKLVECLLFYYNTAQYSLALAAWDKAWSQAKDATDAKGKEIGDRAARSASTISNPRIIQLCGDLPWGLDDSENSRPA
jgi:hypothetical protein